MQGKAGMLILIQHQMRQRDNRVTGHPGSKKPTNRNYRQGTPGIRHNRALNRFNEFCYETGNLNAVRRDYR